jgi:hypothetical protein
VVEKKPIGTPKEEDFPDHEPPVPYDPNFDKEKEKRRKLATQLKKSTGRYDPLITTLQGTIKHASKLTKAEQKFEFVRCASDPIYFIETYLRVFDQTVGTAGELVPFKLFVDQKKLIQSYVDHRFVIANKYRQAGISTTTCAYISHYVMFKENRSVAIVANRLDTAKDELMNDVVDFIDSCPTWLRPKTGKEASKDGDQFKNTQTLKRYDNGSELAAFSSKGLRGYTPTLLFWDETAWTEKGDKFWTSAYPTLQTGGSAIMVSTPNGLDPVYYKTFTGARKKKNEFFAFELWWFNDPRYNKDLCWYKHKDKENEIKIKDEGWTNEERIKLMDDGWTASSPWFEKEVRNANGDMKRIAQELLCSFLGSGDNFIAEDYLKRIEEEEVMAPIRQEYTDLNMWIFEDPIPGEEYIVSVDVSPGHGEDFSTVNILKLKENIENKVITKYGKEKKIKVRKYAVEQVAEYYGKVSPQQLAEIVYQYGRAYNDGYCVVDITGGYGAQTVEKLFELGYENIHYSEVTHKPSRDRLQGYIKQGQKTLGDGSVIMVDLIPGFFIGGNRASVLLEMQRAIHLEDVVIRSHRLLEELKTFVTVSGNRVADHKRTFHDDSIIGLAVGLYVINFEMVRYRQSKGMTEKMLNAFINSNDVNEAVVKDKKKYEPMFKAEPNVDSVLGQYLKYSWLFGDKHLKGRRK